MKDPVFLAPSLIRIGFLVNQIQFPSVARVNFIFQGHRACHAHKSIHHGKPVIHQQLPVHVYQATILVDPHACLANLPPLHLPPVPLPSQRFLVSQGTSSIAP